MKAYFFQRIAAYLIDIILLSLVVGILTLPFSNNKNITVLQEELTSLSDQYLKGEIDTSVYLSQGMEISYDMAYASVGSNIVNVVAVILYFVLFQAYNKGQTLGKKLLRIKVMRQDGEAVKVNDLAKRSLLINAVASNILLLAVTVFASKNIYYYLSNTIQGVQGLLIVITLFMVIFRKDGRGIHDMIANTKVVATGVKEMEQCVN